MYKGIQPYLQVQAALAAVVGLTDRYLSPFLVNMPSTKGLSSTKHATVLPTNYCQTESIFIHVNNN